MIKCIEEEKTGNQEFRSAKQATYESLQQMNMPEVTVFCEVFLPEYYKTLDELEHCSDCDRKGGKIMPGVLFEGGSFRAIFSCGVMDALLDQDVMFPYCIGVSAGAADSASYISRQKERNLNMLLRYRNDKRYMGLRNYFKKEHSLFGVDFVFRKMPNVLFPFDMDTFQNYAGDYVVVTTDANTGKPHYFHKEDVDDRFDVFCASCALPVYFQAVHIGGGAYYDGGVSDPVPIRRLQRDGHHKALIVLTRPEGYRKACGRSDRFAAGVLRRRYPAIADNLLHRYKTYNESVQICEKMQEEGNAVLIRPSEPLNSFEKDTDVLRRSYQMGYDMAMNRMDEIKALF